MATSVLLVTALGIMRAADVWDGSVSVVWDGDGTQASPYLIRTAADLAGLAERTNEGETFEGAYFTLTADLMMSDPATPAEEKPLWTPIGMSGINNGDDEENPGAFWGEDYYFKGNFNGAGHTVYNLWYAHDSEFEDDFNDPFNDGTYDFEGWSKALFGNLEDAVVTNLKLSGVSIQCEQRGAGLACTAKNSLITDISVDGYIQCGSSGTMGGSGAGIVTDAENCVFERCHSEASVKSVSGVGSIAAILSSSTVTDCSSAGQLAGLRGIGGIAGFVNSGSEISGCHSSTDVLQLPAKRQGTDVGGFAGVISGSVVRNCSSTGNLVVDYNGYGFVGSVIDNGLVESCYAVCDITKEGYAVWMASFVGEVGGSHYVGEDPVIGNVRNCYAVARYAYEPTPSDILTSGNHIGGFLGSIYEGSQVANCFYNTDTATGVNTFQPAEGEPGAFEIEFGLTTAYMQSEAFVRLLNEMAGVIGISEWEYEQGNYPVPTGVPASAGVAPFGGGSGTESDPWLIVSKEDLFSLANVANHGWDFRGQYILQTEDIALNAPFEEWGEQMPELWTPIGEFYPSGRYFAFAGTYDGGLHKVENMYIDNNVDSYGGLFGVAGDGAHIRNLGVTDAYIDLEGSTGGILLGSAALWNDDSVGERRISNCWTSGHIEGSNVSGFIGGGSQWGKTVMDNCYTTAEIYSFNEGGGFFARQIVGDMPVYLTASYFNGSFIKNGYERIPPLFNECIVTNCYYSNEAYPVDGDYEYFAYGRSSEYMTTPEFVNELSYASAYSGLESPWKYSEGLTASFFGSAPTVDVTFDIDDETSVSFKAIAGSLLTAPLIQSENSDMLLNGWIDGSTSGIFDFSTQTVTAPLTLTASWSEMITPDYTPFKNKFAKTYTIKTPAQLLALSYIVNGLSDEVEKTDYEGYTIQLGNDIEWNSTESYDSWGGAWSPMPFLPIGDSSNSFAGTFDGQGYTITGLYINRGGWSGNHGMFPRITDKAVVRNLLLNKAFIEVGYTSNDNPYIGILTGLSEGEVYRCGAEGKIIISDTAWSTGVVGGLIGVSSGNPATTSLKECFADVEASLKSQKFGGLIFSTTGNIDNSYAKSSVKWEDYGWFGGVVCVQQGETEIHDCWAASDIEWSYTMEKDGNPGGAVYGSNYTGNTGTYYDMTCLGDAFGPKADWEGNRYDPYLFGTGLETAYMKRMESFVSYDFTDVWGRRKDMNSGYPYLRWTAPGLANDKDGDISVGIDAISAESEVEIFTLPGVSVFKGRYADSVLDSGVYIVKSADGTANKIRIR